MLAKYVKFRGALYLRADWSEPHQVSAPVTQNPERLLLHVHNNRRYHDRLQLMYRNLVIKVARKIYDRELAVKLFMYLVDDVNKAEGLNYSKAVRAVAASSLRDQFEQLLREDPEQFAAMLPKKYQGTPLVL